MPLRLNAHGGTAPFPSDTAAIPRYLAPVMNETERQSEERSWETAKTLAEALPYIQVYDRETVVIKYGGHAMGESAWRNSSRPMWCC